MGEREGIPSPPNGPCSLRGRLDVAPYDPKKFSPELFACRCVGSVDELRSSLCSSPRRASSYDTNVTVVPKLECHLALRNRLPARSLSSEPERSQIRNRRRKKATLEAVRILTGPQIGGCDQDLIQATSGALAIALQCLRVLLLDFRARLVDRPSNVIIECGFFQLCGESVSLQLREESLLIVGHATIMTPSHVEVDPTTSRAEPPIAGPRGPTGSGHVTAPRSDDRRRRRIRSRLHARHCRRPFQR